MIPRFCKSTAVRRLMAGILTAGLAGTSALAGDGSASHSIRITSAAKADSAVVSENAPARRIRIVPAVKVSSATVMPSADQVPLPVEARFASLPADESAVLSEEAAPSMVIEQPGVNATSYRAIYDSIPFIRDVYDVNPSYRHDATMEILTGNARHQTIVHHSTTPVDRTTREPAEILPHRALYPGVRVRGRMRTPTNGWYIYRVR